MRCPYCGFTDTKVTDSRDADDGIRRRRECLSCGQRFTTLERLAVGSLLVGSLASHWGTGPVLAVSAALPLLATVVFVATTPWLRRLQ